jgi:hypothetical protein
MLKKSSVQYRRERDLDPTEFQRLLAQSRLGAVRPIADPDRVRRMLTGSQLVITARDVEDLRLLGVALRDRLRLVLLPQRTRGRAGGARPRDRP